VKQTLEGSEEKADRLGGRFGNERASEDSEVPPGKHRYKTVVDCDVAAAGGGGGPYRLHASCSGGGERAREH
jgi:hypothetical protein